jgi:LacI family transcriptional regulator
MKRAHLKKETFLVEHESELTPKAIAELLGGPAKPDAIFSLNGMMTMLLLQALRKLRRKIGTDIPLISFDDFELAAVLTPSLTVVRQPSAELGRRAAEMLFARIEGKGIVPCREIVLSTTFHIRESCGCTEQ